MNLAVRYHEFGDPTKVLQLRNFLFRILREMLVGDVSFNDSSVRSWFDQRFLRQSSCKLPAIGGREGVGKVIEVGSQADRKLVGRIVSMSESMGTWQTFTTINANELIFLPSLVPLEQLTVAILNSSLFGVFCMTLSI